MTRIITITTNGSQLLSAVIVMSNFCLTRFMPWSLSIALWSICISKPEAAHHSKLTVHAIIHKTISTPPQLGSHAYIANWCSSRHTKNWRVYVCHWSWIRHRLSVRQLGLSQAATGGILPAWLLAAILKAQETRHSYPQYPYYSLFLRKYSVTVPTVLEKLLFIKPDSENDK